MRYISIFLLVLASQLTFGQKEKLDSLYIALENHPLEDSLRAEILNTICYLESTAHPEKSKVHAEELLAIAKKMNNGKNESRAFRYLSEYYFYIGDNAEATRYAYEMLKAAERSSYQVTLGQSYMMLSRASAMEGDFEKSKSNSLKAVEVFEKAGLKMHVGYAYNGLGALHFTYLKYNEAYEYFIKSVEIWEALGHKDGLYSGYGNLAEIFRVKKKYDEAVVFFEKSLSLSKQTDNRFQTASSYAGLGGLYTAMDKYDKAEFYLSQSVAMGKELKNKRLLEESYSLLAGLEKKRNRLKNALEYLELKSLYHDSIYTEDKSRQIAEMEARYETEKKEQAIQLLERDKRIQTLWKNILSAGLALVLFASATAIILLRYRERKNFELFNLRIDYLTSQQKELSQKYQHAITSIGENDIEPEASRTLKKALEIVEKYIDDPLFNVEKMAEEMHMSRASLHRKLKSIAGISPSDFIRSVRLKRAAALLRKKVDSITQVGFMVGFDDQSHFSRSFKKQFGVSPSEYTTSLANN
jgi:AraC-like DNA-binding protein